MAKSIVSITHSLLLVLLLLTGESFAQTTIRDGGAKGVADVIGSAPSGTEQGLVTRPIMPTGATSAAVAIRCVNAAGNAFESCGGSGGGGTQYAEDSVHASGDSLTMAGVVQKSADAALAGDGDNTVLQVDSNGYLKVNIKAGAGSGGTAMVDDAPFTPATTSGTPAFFMFDDVSPDTVNEGDGGVGRMSANRNQYVQIRDNAGNERGLNVDVNGEIGIGAIRSALPAGTNGIGKLTANSGVTIGSVEIAAAQTLATVTNLATIGTSVTPGTSAAHLGKAEDAAHASGDTGVAVFAKRTDTAASSSTTDGDYSTLNTDSIGRLWTRPTGSVTPANSFSIPTDAITVWSINGCYNGTTIDLCQKASAGQGAVDSTTQRVTMAQASTACPNYAAISQTADTAVITATASQYVYICSIILVAGAAEVVSIWEGTGTACGTSSAAMLGSTTEANGLSVAANGGFSAVNGLPFLRTASTNVDVCVRQSGSNRVSGVITYAKGT